MPKLGATYINVLSVATEMIDDDTIKLNGSGKIVVDSMSRICNLIVPATVNAGQTVPVRWSYDHVTGDVTVEMAE